MNAQQNRLWYRSRCTAGSQISVTFGARERLFIVTSKTGSPHGPRQRRCQRIFTLLSEYLDGKLPARQAKHIKLHLCDCVPCQAFLDDLKRSVERCRRVRPEGMDPRRAKQVRELLMRAFAQVRTKK
jgi:Putative zinc-finger